MYNSIRNTKSLLAAIATLTLAAACTHDMHPDTPAPELGYNKVGLNLTISDISSSRATPDGNYDDARMTAYENYINIPDGDYRIMLFEPTAPHTLVSCLSDVRVTAVEADIPTSKTYTLTGNLPKSVRNGSYKLLILANWEGCGASYPETAASRTTIDDICSASTFHYSEDFDIGPGRGIPMYGIKHCADVEFRQTVAADLGTIHMLRAMAKIEIRQTAGSLPITGAALSRCNDKGLAAPYKVYEQSDYVKDNYTKDYLDKIHIPDNANVITDIPLIRRQNGSYTIYVPEYDNISDGAEKARLSLSFEKADGQDYFIDFKFYDNKTAQEAGSLINTPFDIQRNYYYIYTVDKKRDTELKIDVDVIPYTGVSLNPEFGLSVDENGNKTDKNGNIVVTGKDGRIILKIHPDGQITDKDGATIVLDADNSYKKTDASGTVLWEMEKTGNKYFIRDNESNLIAIVTLN